MARGALAEVRIRGLWAGLDVAPGGLAGRELCERLLAHGVLAKDTHGHTIRLAPPLVSTESDIDVSSPPSTRLCRHVRGARVTWGPL